jgi:hypothetical protein
VSADKKASRAAAVTVARAVAEMHGATTMAKVVVDPFVEQLARTLSHAVMLATAARVGGKSLAVCMFFEQMVIDLRAYLEQEQARRS